MYIKLVTTNDNTTLIAKSIYSFNDPEKCDGDITLENVNEQLTSNSGIEIPESQIVFINSIIEEFGKDIKLGITMYGMDTTKLTDSQFEKSQMLNIHPALYSLYFTEGGLAYRCTMSSREKAIMIREYENEQKILGGLLSHKFCEIEFSNDDYGRQFARQFNDIIRSN